MDKSMFKVGDTVCYFKSREENQEPFQGLVLEVKNLIKISYFDAPLQKIIWVSPEEIRKQDTHRCSHNAECGLCDDTGKCFYE